MIRIRTHRRALGAAGAALAIALAGSTARAQGTAVLTGTIRDTASTAPVPGAVVTVTSPSLQGEQTVVTDASGHYRLAGLPPGTYLIRIDKEAYRPFVRPQVTLRIDTTIRYDGQLLPETLRSDDIVVVDPAPGIDVGSSGTGVHVGADFLGRIPLGPPGSKGAVTRSFESLADVAPGGGMDRYGAAIGGATSPENHYLIDGLSVNDPGFGVLGTPLSTAFIKEVNVLTGGYLPEYGRATGGHFDVVTKSGSNEVHGSIFAAYSPGIFEGPRRPVVLTGNAITTRNALSSAFDFGAEVGGPIVRDKLWFYVGVSPSFARYRLDRGISQVRLLGGQPVMDNGVPVMDPVADTGQIFYATQRSVQAIAKLTWRPSENNTLSLSVFGTPTFSGGDGTLGFTGRDGALEIDNSVNSGVLNGSFTALAHRYVSLPIDTVLKWSTASSSRRVLLDTTVGWHHQEEAIRASDGSRIASGEGLSNVAQVFWQRTDPGPHSINDVEASPATKGCDDITLVATTRCPVSTYWSGGPGYLAETSLDRWEGKSVLTLLFEAAGHHVVKLGADAERLSYRSQRGYSGTTVYAEGSDGQQFIDFRRYGSLSADGRPTTLDAFEATSRSTSIGGFLQDSYAPVDNLTFNVGVRYDMQLLYGDRPAAALSLPNQWAPRVGVIYDPTGKGRSRIFASYARYYEGMPLDIIDRTFSGESQISSIHDAKLCDPRQQTPDHGGCESDASRLPLGGPPNPLWTPFGSGHAAVDPDLAAESSDEVVVGAEYEIFPAARLGLTYTKRWQNRIIEDMSTDDAATFFVGNPGYGVAKDFPVARRDYDAVTLYFDRAFRRGLLAQASYTVSALRGNWAGLFRAETGQLDPNMSSDFDLVSLLPNRSGPLPGDHTHQIKLYAAKDFDVGQGSSLNLGIAWRSRSGEPTTFLGSHPIYGPGEVYILPRGSGERLPWVHTVDLRLGVRFALGRESSVLASVDVFNVFNFQAAVARDQRFTLDSVRPIDGGTTADISRLQTSDGAPFDPHHKNPSFGDPIAYQPPRAFRFGITTTF
jgi:carboxypeptidase family protein/TonB-dependent receptor-like protein